MPKVSIHIVTYNSQIFLDPLLISLAHQTLTDFSVLVVDNASTDGTVPHLRARWPTIALIQNRDNAGFARAHNQAIHLTVSEYVLALNADIILHERFLERLSAVLDALPALGSVSGKLLRAIGDPREIGRNTLSEIMDSTGIVGDRKRYWHDRGAGEQDCGQYDQRREILGPSGAAGLYRRCALETIRWRNEYFDELFDSYKEDVDCALRLQRMGWQSQFVPQARAWHWRRVAGSVQFTTDTLRHMNARPSRIVFLSYRNHLYTLLKNETFATCWRNLPWIFGWEFGKMGFLLCTKPMVVFRAGKDVVKNWKLLKDKRSRIYDANMQMIYE